SFDNAEGDIEARQLIEAKNEAETILSAVDKGKAHAAWQKLSPDELQSIQSAEAQLQGSLAAGSYREIRQNIEQLDKATRRFAELMMDLEVMGAMKGQTMQSAGESIGV